MSSKLEFGVRVVLILILGAIIGWFTGISASPIVQVVLSTLLSFVTILLALGAAKQTSSTDYYAPKLPKLGELLAVVVFAAGIVAGAIQGIDDRTYQKFGPPDDWHVARLKRLGYEEAAAKTKVAEWLFNVSAAGPGPRAPVLFMVEQTDCADLLRSSPDPTYIVQQFEKRGGGPARLASEFRNQPEVLQRTARALCEGRQ